MGALLRLYPAAWRAEYGPELTGILLERPLSARVLADVVSNGLVATREGCRTVHDSGTRLDVHLADRARPERRTLRRGRVDGAAAVLDDIPHRHRHVPRDEFYVLLLAGCGYWTYRRHAGKPSRCGVAAMRMSLIAGIPVMVIALLMVFGVVDLMPLDAHAAARMRPSAWAILAAPLARVPEAWIWGSLGGLIGKYLARRRQAASPNSCSRSLKYSAAEMSQSTRCPRPSRLQSPKLGMPVV